MSWLSLLLDIVSALFPVASYFWMRQLSKRIDSLEVNKQDIVYRLKDGVP